MPEEEPATERKPHKANLGYSIAGVAVAVIGWAVGTNLVSKDPTFDAAAGISVFALVYVLAQVVERVVEFFLSLLDSAAKATSKELAPTTKANAVMELQWAPAGSTTKKDAKEKAESASSDTKALAFGLALGLAAVACGYFEVGLLKMVGVANLDSWVDRLVSSVIIAGGSKPLHDLISKVEKSKEKDEQTTGT